MKWIPLLLCLIGGMGFLKSSAQSGSNAAKLDVKGHMPRFLYEGDRLEVRATITNLDTAERTGQMQLLLSDAETAASVDGWFQNVFPVQYFTVAAGKGDTLRFPIEAPYLFRKQVHWRLAVHDSVFDQGVFPVRFADTTPIQTASPLRLSKRMLHKPPGQNAFIPVTDGATIRVGDSLKMQLLVWSQQDVRQIELKDPLPAALTPVSPSMIQPAQEGVYNPRDSTGMAFFRPILRKGKTVFAYTVVAMHAGVFHGGPATIQLMNKPKAWARSAPIQLRIEE